MIYRVNSWRHAHWPTRRRGGFGEREGKIADARDPKAPRGAISGLLHALFPWRLPCSGGDFVSFFDEMVASRRGLHGRI